MLDRVLAALLLVLLGPILLTTALLIRLRLGPGVLFRQQRVGRFGDVFTVLKFRTMLPDRRKEQRPFPGPDRRETHKSADDPRHTPLGRALRTLGIDELPQLINVLRGEMSLVGPRPELVDVVREEYALREHARHLVRPGLTGPWQISDRRNADGDMHEHVEVDLDYVRSVSPLVDVRLLLLTAPALLRSGGS